MENGRRAPLLIDPLSKTTRLNQVFMWTHSQIVAGSKPHKLAMHFVRTALTKEERKALIDKINRQLGERYGFTCRWSGNSKGRLYLRIDWKDS